MNVLAVDPGSSESAYVFLRDGCPVKFDKIANDVLRAMLSGDSWYGWLGETPEDVLAVEYMKPRGMPTSAEEMTTMFELGRLVEAWAGPWRPVSRQDVKMTLCGNARAKDSNVRQAVIDHYGGEAATKPAQKCSVCRGRGDTRCPGCNGGPKARLTCEWCLIAGEHTGRMLCRKCSGVGTVAPPGILHGMAGDCWQALAVALTWLERNGNHD
jgi:hypothetical protein